MTPLRPAVSPRVATLAGLAGLASAMGVGRFAFTPLMPLMQAHGSLGLSEGAALAAANYLGYLVGALACGALQPQPHRAARLGLVAVALLTLGMGLTGRLEFWLALRFAAGLASACVLVGISAWSLALLAERGRLAWSGWVFAGVGIGIALAGGVGLLAGLAESAPAQAWLLLGLASALVAALVWAPLQALPAAAPPAAQARHPLGRAGRRLVLAYASFGFGYIIPASFLPSMARELIADPAIFGWVWPVFGLAAAASTVLAAFGLRHWPPRRLWLRGQLLMLVGVLLPVLWLHVATLMLSALCVGGSFMVITMAAMQEARRIGGSAATRLMAAMTAAFALGQLAGPFTVALAAWAGGDGITVPSLLAVGLLLAGCSLLREAPARPGVVPVLDQKRNFP